MKSFIYEFRFVFYGMICGIPIGKAVAKYTELSLLPHILICMTIMIGLFPIINALDKNFIRK